MSRLPTPISAALVFVLVGVAPGCGRSAETAPASSRPHLDDAADSLAMRVVDGAGGLAAFESLPALRWDFILVRDSSEESRRRHLWDRARRRHRIEWSVGDSVIVAVFGTERAVEGRPAWGDVYFQGVPVDSASRRRLLRDAYGRFINDMYWLLAPLKLFDPGVRRAVAADSADEATDVLALSFDTVGLTPGDRYWLRVDRGTGRMIGWSYHLESDRLGAYAWTDHRTIQAPAGAITLPTRKSAVGRPSVILTPFAAGVVDSTFANASPRLEPLR